MIYVDTSVALAYLFNEQLGPDEAFWNQPLVASELLEYELVVRARAHGVAIDTARDLLSRIATLPLSRPVLTRALEPFPAAVRTLDALHLASMDFLRSQAQDIALATLDHRMTAAATAMGFALATVAPVHVPAR